MCTRIEHNCRARSAVRRFEPEVHQRQRCQGDCALVLAERPERDDLVFMHVPKADFGAQDEIHRRLGLAAGHSVHALNQQRLGVGLLGLLGLLGLF